MRTRLLARAARARRQRRPTRAMPGCARRAGASAAAALRSMRCAATMAASRLDFEVVYGHAFKSAPRAAAGSRDRGAAGRDARDGARRTPTGADQAANGCVRIRAAYRGWYGCAALSAASAAPPARFSRPASRFQLHEHPPSPPAPGPRAPQRTRRAVGRVASGRTPRRRRRRLRAAVAAEAQLFADAAPAARRLRCALCAVSLGIGWASVRSARRRCCPSPASSCCCSASALLALCAPRRRPRDASRWRGGTLRVEHHCGRRTEQRLVPRRLGCVSNRRTATARWSNCPDRASASASAATCAPNCALRWHANCGWRCARERGRRGTRRHESRTGTMTMNDQLSTWHACARRAGRPAAPCWPRRPRMAVSDLPGGPAVNQLDLHAAGIGAWRPTCSGCTTWSW